MEKLRRILLFTVMAVIGSISVSAQSLELYKTTEPWKQFGRITAIGSETADDKPVIEVPEDAKYFWASNGEVTEVGGKIVANDAAEGRVNYFDSGYYSICLNGAKDFSTAYFTVTLDEPLADGDTIYVTAYRNKNADNKSTGVIFRFNANEENESTLTSGDGETFNNINPEYTTGDGKPNQVAIIVTAAQDGCTSFDITRQSTQTNLFITELYIKSKSSDSQLASHFCVDDVWYNILSEEERTVEVTYDGENLDNRNSKYAGDIVIPAEVEYNGTTYNVAAIANDAFFYCQSLKTVKLPSSIRTIGNAAFSGCIFLTSVELPNSGVKTIGDYAFSECSRLRSVDIPGTITKIGINAFGYCDSLKTVVCWSEIPLDCAFYKVFLFTNISESILLVPAQSLELYKATAPWNEFGNIVAIEGEGGFAILKHNGEKIFYYGEEALVEAIAIAEDGDEIQLSAGEFKAADIDKAVTIHGNGWLASDSVTPTKLIGDFLITLPVTLQRSGQQRITLSGIYHDGRITHKNGKCSFIQSRLGELNIQQTTRDVSEKNSEAYLRQSKVQGAMYVTSGNAVFCENSFIYDPHTEGSGSIRFEHCMVFNLSNEVSNSCFSNTIIDCCHTVALDSSNSASFCLSVGGNSTACFDLIGNETCKTLVGHDIFKTFGAWGFTDEENYELTAEAAMTYIGVDRTQIGINGGQYPFDGTTPKVSDFYVDGLWYHIVWEEEGAVALIFDGYYDEEYEIFYKNSYYRGDIAIPSAVTYNGKTFTVTKIGPDAFTNCSELTAVDIPNSVTSIEGMAFRNCSNLETITCRAVTPPACSDNVFYNVPIGSCTLNVPAESIELYRTTEPWSEFLNIVAIEGTGPIEPHFCVNGIWYNILSKEDKTVEVTNDTIINANGAMEVRSYYVGDVVVPSEVRYGGVTFNVVAVGKYAFKDCEELVSVTLPETINTIEAGGFEYSTKLQTVNIPDGVTSIGVYAFVHCSSLASVSIPASVRTIGGGAFAGCNLSVLECHNPFKAEDGLLIDLRNNELLSCFKALSHVDIPDGIVSISTDAFEFCDLLQSVSIPESVTSIGHGAFCFCPQLQSVTVPNSVTSIGYAAFRDCAELKSVVLPQNVKELGVRMFMNCVALDELTVMSPVPPTCGENAFYNVPTNTCTLRVQYTSIERYRTTEPWSAFLNIHAYDYEGVCASVEFSYDAPLLTMSCATDYTDILYTVTPSNPSIKHVSIAEFLEMADEDTDYELTGVVTEIRNTLYGNYYISDGTASIYIYGTLDLDGEQRQFATLGIEIGDEITLYGKYILYNGSLPEIVNAQYVRTERKADGSLCGDVHLYSEPVKLAEPCIVRAIASREGYISSQTSTYMISGKVPTEPCAPVEFAFNEPWLTMTTATEGAEIIYTLDGSTPGEAVLWSGSFTVGNWDGGFGDLSWGAYDWSNVPVGTLLKIKGHINPEGTYEPTIRIANGSWYQLPGTEENIIIEDSIFNITLVLEEEHISDMANNGGLVLCGAWFVVEEVSLEYHDGSSYLVYTEPIEITESCTVKAIARKDGHLDSEVTEYEIILGEPYFCVDGIWYNILSRENRIAEVTHGEEGDMYADYVEIPEYVEYDGREYRVVAIGDRAFRNSSRLYAVSIGSNIASVEGNAFADCSGLAAVKWGVEYAMPDTLLPAAFAQNPNHLLYCGNPDHVPGNVRNVVVNGEINTDHLVLSPEGNFYAIEPFHVNRISYNRSFTMRSGKGFAEGWETLSLPFDVQTVWHRTKATEIAPFKALEERGITEFDRYSDPKPFWLYELSDTGFAASPRIEANVPYIISMPNNAEYIESLRLGGEVSFRAADVIVPKTEAKASRMGNVTFVPTTVSVAEGSGVMAINSYQDNDGNRPGSAFILNLRAIQPFEAYLMAEMTRAMLRLADLKDASTGINPSLNGPLDADNGATYNLNGLRVDRNYKGIVIKNGQKILRR